VPLAEEADRLPLAPDLAEEGGAFVIESDEEMGVGPGDAEGLAMDSLVKSVNAGEKDEGGAVSVDFDDGKASEERPQLL